MCLVYSIRDVTIINCGKIPIVLPFLIVIIVKTGIDYCSLKNSRRTSGWFLHKVQLPLMATRYHL